MLFYLLRGCTKYPLTDIFKKRKKKKKSEYTKKVVIKGEE
jgi:hypothetical protein